MIRFFLPIFLLPLTAFAGNFAADNFIANKSVEYFDPAGSGYDVMVQAPALTAGWVFTLPIGPGNANYQLITDGSGNTSWAAPPAAVTPGGSNTDVQFNNSGSFGGSANMTWVSPTLALNGAGVSGAGAMKISAAPYSGGTATTNKPQLWMEWGAPTSNAWSTAGTAFGIDAASAFAGNMIDAQVNAVDVMSVNYLGVMTLGPATPYYTGWSGLTIKPESSSGQGGYVALYSSNGNGPALIETGSSSGYLYIQDNTKSILNSDGTGDVGLAACAADGLANLDTLCVQNQASQNSHNTFTIIGIASQTANLQRWENSGGSVLSYVDITGKGYFANLADTALGAGVVRSDSSGNLTSAEISGDATTSGSNALTLATVNSSPGTCTNATVVVNGKGLTTSCTSGTAPITSLTVATANGFGGSSSGGATPALTLTTSCNGVCKGNGTAISTATAGTDYAAATTGTSSQMLANNGSGGFSNVTVGTGLSLSGGTLSASGGASGFTAHFTLNGAIIPYTAIDSSHYQQSTVTLSTVYLSCLNSGTAGSTTFRVNDYSGGSLSASATASLSASSGNPASSAASLSASLSLTAGDVITVDVTANATGASDCALEY